MALTLCAGIAPALAAGQGAAGDGLKSAPGAVKIAARPAAEVLAGAVEFQQIQPGEEPAKGTPPARAPAPPSTLAHSYAQVKLGQTYGGEVEPNGTSATATPIASGDTVIRAPLYPNGDIDFYSFTANAGDRVYAALMTAFSAGSSTDSQLTIIGPDGTTIVEFDDDNGTFAALSSSIAGAVIPTTGTYYLKVNDFTAGTTSQRPYELHFRIQSGTPTPEVESNDTPATATPLPANGWVSGARNPAAATEQDWYSINLNAGDTVFLSLDLDPERDGVSWNGRLGFALFGDAGNQILPADDAGTGDVSPNPNIPSEAMFFTVKDSGTYFAFVDSASAAVGGPTATYNLSVSVHRASNEGVNCTTYTSTDVPKTIGPGTGLVSSTITVPGNPVIADVDVIINLNHALMQDVDAHLRSPAGNDNGLFTDIGAAATGGQQQMDAVFDDEAGITPFYTALRGVQIKPENNSTAGTASTSGGYRLAAFDGENAGGTWTLDLRDDTAGANGGTLNSWALRICEAPPPPSCPPGFATQTVLATDFESGAAGFTHTGAQDEWELGLPATVATTTANPVASFSSCNSGVNCWKTDLDNTYNASSNQDLLSPAINLAGLTPPIVVTWAQRHQVETANFDHFFVDFQQVGGATPVRLYEWLDPTPISATAGTGNPQNNIGGSYGWGVHSRRADSLAGLNTELRFHLDSDTTVQFGGVAIDDVSVTGCRALQADASITKSDGVTTATPGGSVTYTITASNAGPDPANGATVADTFPAIATCTWTCVGAGGGTCTASGSGNIADSVNLPAGGSVTYTASCTIAASATGSLSNTATVALPFTDTNPANNSATDTDTLAPSADLAVTKTDGVTSATPGGSVTYTVTSSNAGPSNAPGATVADTFPASLTCTWTCVGAGGGTCTASGSGNISDTVNLPAGGSVTHTASCAISAAATGSLGNTATVAAPAGVTDPTPGNNSATDTDALTPSADLSITKTDGVTSATPGGSVTYTINAANAGPSNAPGATVADTFPASLTCTWTCVGGGGGTCTASGSGNIGDTVNLPAGGLVTYTASCTISAAASGTLSNTATVAAPGGMTDPTPGNNSATDTDSLAASADLSITKTDGVTSATPGGSVTYTITASNAGPSNAGATVADTFPAPLTCTWTCVGAGGGTCTASGSGNISDAVNLPNAGSVTYTASCTISAAATGSLVNTATVAAGAGVTDPTPGNNSATDTDALGASADLSITKTDGVTSATPGGSVTYTISAANAGPSNAAATVADTFPAPLTCTWTCVGAGGGTCTASGSGNISDAVNLPSGGSVTYTASCTISASATGSLVNTATVAAGAGVTDPTPGNNSATDTDALGASADLSITKTDGVTSATPGGSVTYTITASNAGPSNAAATVADTFPAPLTCTWTCVGAGGGTCTASGSGNISDAVNLPNAGSVTYTASCTISAAATGALANTATVTAGAGVTDPTPGNNSATDTDALGASADLSITKTDGVTSATPGGSVTYTITASNAGPSNAAATVADTFPAPLTCTWTCVGAGGGTCAASGSGNISDAVNLPSGGSVTYTASCAISAAATGALVNTATVTAAAGVTDTNPANNSATDTDALGASADLSITKTDGVTAVTAGSSTTYTIMASNSGPSDASGASVTDMFPAGLTCTWTCAGTAGGTCTASGSGSISDTANLPSGGSATYTAVCAISSATTGSLSNTATVSAPASVTDTNPANNSATDTDTVQAAPAAVLSATKSVTAAAGFLPGTAVTYTVVISNTGTAAQTDNPGNEFVDTLPAGLNLVAANATSGSVTTAANGVSWNGTVPAGGSVTITINATISSSASGTISNQGTVFYDGDANGSNESSAPTDDPAAAGAADPTSFVVTGTPASPATPVPALSSWTLLLMALGLAGLAWWRRMLAG
ncbi:proprotein convertase P-domain-containing protein [Tahibacter sp. P2K]|uniref:Proprotein convertase P-domain-containing protein n=2 Tax=Tahibacter harae TaxID=2963937 RepID=A0ABT1QTS5_9GAMM|nr:proprotein convertase P-domain-containing protein [Tahibacter harae]